MTTKWTLLLLASFTLVLCTLVQNNANGEESCPSVCDQNACSVPESDCFAGMIKDRCNCCLVCGQREGERCFNEALRGKLFQEYYHYKDCGENLQCRMRTDLEAFDKPEAICYCNKTEPICGNDGVTYANECQFTEARYKKRNDLFQLDAGPCRSKPDIVTPPEDITNNTGSSVAFSCEAKGWPVPYIEWRVQGENGEILLPSDNNHISVQSRGGPGDYEVTSWLQLINIKREHSGLYTCVAINSEGESKASAYLTAGNFKKTFV